MRCQHTARYQALAHLEDKPRHWQAPLPQPKVIYQLEMEVGRREKEGEGRKEGTGGRRGSQSCGEPQVEDTKAGRSGPEVRGEGSRRHPKERRTGGGEVQPGGGGSAKAGHHGQRVLEGGQPSRRE